MPPQPTAALMPQAHAAVPLSPHEFATALAPILDERPAGLVLAVSGGPDSTALMHLTAGLAQSRAMPPLMVATVDHCLRPGASADADQVMAEAGRLGLSARRLAWTGPKPSRDIQAKARAARYALLVGCCRETGASHLLTAHTADDQAETILFRLARGSGPAGLAGMAARTMRDGIVLARPLLAVPKARLLATCAAGGWPYATDPSNRDPRFARTRFRALLPALEAEGLGEARLSALGARFARAEAALDWAAGQAAAIARRPSQPGTLAFDAATLRHLPAELVMRVLDEAIRSVTGRPASRLDHRERLASALSQEPASVGWRRTLNGATVTVGLDGALVVALETPRRRGAGPIPPQRIQLSDAQSSQEPGPGPASLGKGDPDPYIGG